MRVSKKSRQLSNKKIAAERIETLFKQAKDAFQKDPSLSNRYVTLGRKLSMKYKVRIPSELKRQFCKHCYKFLMPGKNCRVRSKDGKMVYFCMNCKKFTRLPYRK